MSNPDTIAERVAVLESKVHTVLESQELIINELKAVNESLTKYKGFVGGIAFVLTSFITFLSFAKEWVISHLIK